MSVFKHLLLFIRSCLVVQAVCTAHVDKPNIILFVIDDLGWNDTGYQGADYTTPTIDSLAAEGIRLGQYYVQPLCSPSRAALLAGRYPYHLGLASDVITNGHPYGLGLEETIFAQPLKKGGYTTHIIGKWDVGMSKWEYTPTYRGFDTFYGFYGSDEDHFSHIYYTSYTDPSNPCERVTTHGVDLRRNTAPLTRENGSYSTHLFTRAIQEVIIQSQEEDSEKPFFVYGAYQAVHNPLQVPEEYLENCSSIPYFEHKIFCGMMQALDEGIMNITETLDDRGLLDNTVIILTTDNGGQTKQGSSNWPLRGNKGTVFEGGVRGVAFVWGQMLANTNYNYGGLMHITDWYKTIVEGIAGIDIGEDVTKNLDGYNMWQALTHNEPSPRSEILLQLNPPSYTTSPHLSHFAGQAAFRSGDWKLISGVPDCDPALKMSCPTGWVHLDGFIENPPFNPTLTWLFNVTADPNEKHNLAESFPDVVSQLKQRIEDFNSTHIPQVRPPFDPRADPDNFEGVWTPWLN